ncbi:MAG: transcriptional regulator, HxlR family [Thermomicrobiales bacterium]|nr:transcriptional regulator, HxlR family [Thermomicrobiales bacterium]
MTTQSNDAATEGKAEARRSLCPVACALDVVGDRWTLLVIRDLLGGKRRYGDFLASAEKIPTNILADRLKRLEREGLIARAPYSTRPPRDEYHLTPEGGAPSMPWRRGGSSTAPAQYGASGPARIQASRLLTLLTRRVVFLQFR